jgi:hypothetical protein
LPIPEPDFTPFKAGSQTGAYPKELEERSQNQKRQWWWIPGTPLTAQSQTGAHPTGPAEKPQNQERQWWHPRKEDNAKQQISGEEGFVRCIVLGAITELTWQ